MVNRFTSREVDTTRRRRPSRLVPGPAGAVYVVFGLNGFLFANWVTRLPAVRDRLGASEPELGVALLGLAIGSVATMPATSWLCDRFGLQSVMRFSIIACVGGWQLAVAAPSIPTLFAALVVTGGMFGLWDVAMNASGHAVEKCAARTLMPGFHGAFSVGGLVGAGLGAGAAALHLHTSAHIALAGGLALIVGLPASRLLLAPAETPNVDRTSPATAPSRHRRVPVHLLVLGVVAACAAMGEGAAADWGAIFLHDERGAHEATAAAGYAVFSMSMAAGRFGGSWILARVPRVRALQMSGLLVTSALVALVAVDAVGAALLAMVVWGFGVALVFPAIMSAAAERAARPAHGIAIASMVGYGGFLLGPPSIGFVAGRLGLGVALWIVALLGLLLALLAPVARSGGEQDRPIPVERDAVTV